MRIGILGGTFNPVHNGHLFLALEAKNELKLDRVILIPNARPPHKDSPSITPEIRFEMLQRAVQDEPALEVSRVELEREGVSYTVDTLDSFPKDYQLVFLCGADAFDSKWHRLEDVLTRLHTLAIAYRNRPPDEHPAKLRALPPELRSKIISLEFPDIGISSSEIRQRVKDFRPIRYLVPDTVYQYILNHKLYSSA